MVNSFSSPLSEESTRKESVGKRILVLGASFYCSHGSGSDAPCRFFAECTDRLDKQELSRFRTSYGNSRGVPQAAFRRAKVANNVEGMNAVVKVLPHDDGTPLWQE